MEVQATMTTSLFNLPPVVDRVERSKRYAAPVNLDVLKDQQREAFDKMWRFIQQSDGGFFRLLGYAGTGKTFVVDKLIEHYLNVYRSNWVLVTAPINKAVRVSRNMADYYHSNLHYSTVHSALGLKESFDDYGKQIFVQDKTKEPSIANYNLMFVDEVSMLTNELFHYLPEYVDKKGLKIIFIGDPCQAPPIGQIESLPLTDVTAKEFGIETAELTQIIRQAADNPIIQQTMALRENIHRPISIPIRTDNLTEKDGVVSGVKFLNTGDGQTLQTMLKALYRSDNFRQHSDFVKVVAWTNDTVNFMNNVIRKIIFGKNVSSKIVVGEQLLADTPIINEMDRKIMFTTNDEFVVRSFEIECEEIPGVGSLRYYKTEVECFDYSHPRRETIRIVHEDSEALYEKLCDQLRQIALGHKKGSWLAKQAWEEFFNFKDFFANVKYCYAITCHKCQGSSYDCAIVFEGNIDQNPRVLERNKLKYTAFTRPRRLLVIVNG